MFVNRCNNVEMVCMQINIDILFGYDKHDKQLTCILYEWHPVGAVIYCKCLLCAVVFTARTTDCKQKAG